MENRTVVCQNEEKTQEFDDEKCLNDEVTKVPISERPCAKQVKCMYQLVALQVVVNRFHLRQLQWKAVIHIHNSLVLFSGTNFFSFDCNYLVYSLFRWHASEWTDCSTKCGHGHQNRRVFCAIEEDGIIKVIFRLFPFLFRTISFSKTIHLTVLLMIWMNYNYLSQMFIISAGLFIRLPLWKHLYNLSEIKDKWFWSFLDHGRNALHCVWQARSEEGVHQWGDVHWHMVQD